MGWILASLVASVAQTARNAAQRGLTASVGTMGAAAVRFFFGLPFAALFLALWSLHAPPPLPGARVLGWVAAGGLAQIAATALMLRTMQSRSFGVTTALLKTEPVTLAIAGALVLHEPLGPARLAAIATATLGVLLASGTWRGGGWRAGLLGVAAGALFGLSAIGFRAAILALDAAELATGVATVLVLTLAMQTAVMMAWLGLADRAALRGILRHWRESLGAGFLGAFASFFWFLGFALTSAANVRTLALVEVVIAQAVSGRFLREGASPRQLVGMALILAGVAALIRVRAG